MNRARLTDILQAMMLARRRASHQRSGPRHGQRLRRHGPAASARQKPEYFSE